MAKFYEHTTNITVGIQLRYMHLNPLRDGRQGGRREEGEKTGGTQRGTTGRTTGVGPEGRR